MKKVCRACHGNIDSKKERSVHVEDWNCNKMEAEAWFHLKCFNKSMNRDLNILEKQAFTMLKKADTIFNNLPEEFKREEYIIK